MAAGRNELPSFAAAAAPAAPALRLHCARALLPYWHYKQPQDTRKG